MLDQIQAIFSNRELATLIWLVIFAVSLICVNNIRNSAIRLSKTVINPKILFILGTTGLYLSLVVLALLRLGLDYDSIYKDAIFWTMFSGLGLAGNAILTDGDSKKSLKSLIGITVTAAVFTEFVVGLFSFSLIIELFLIPIGVALICIESVAQQKDETKNVAIFSRAMLCLIGLSMVIYTLYELTKTPEKVLNLETGLQFTLPFVLAISFLPILYMFALISIYETLFLRLSHAFQGDEKKVKSFKLKVVFKCKANLNVLQTVSERLSREIWSIDSIETAQQLLDEI